MRAEDVTDTLELALEASGCDSAAVLHKPNPSHRRGRSAHPADAAPMRSLLSDVDLSGKTLLPFITHGGFGPGDAMAEVRNLAPDATFVTEFVLQCDQERDNLNAMRGRLDEVGILGR